ncbi:hypothetical protein CR513_53385, partial [Mucuna pruriens]
MVKENFHQTLGVEIPQQHGVVKRKHKYILVIARALIFQAQLPKIIWRFAITHAIRIGSYSQKNVFFLAINLAQKERLSSQGLLAFMKKFFHISYFQNQPHFFPLISLEPTTLLSLYFTITNIISLISPNPLDSPIHFTYKYPLSISAYLSSSHKYFSLAKSSTLEPSTYANAIKMRIGVIFREKQTVGLNFSPPSKKPIGCKWHKANDFIEQYKAPLVAQGLTQTSGLITLETFSLVVKMTTVRVFVSLASSLNWHLHQLDVNTDILHGDLHEEVYKKVPSCLISHNSSFVCKMEKSPCDLHQASLQWNAKLILFFFLLDFDNDLSEINHIKQLKIINIEARNVDFPTKNPTLSASRNTFLGLITRSKQRINMYQHKLAWCQASFYTYGLQGQFSHQHWGTLSDPTCNKRLIERLLYLTRIRLDISFVLKGFSGSEFGHVQILEDLSHDYIFTWNLL